MGGRRSPDAQRHRYFRQCLSRAPNLRWVQSTAAGVDALVTRDLLDGRVLVSRNPTSSATVAHHAMGMAWALMRRIPDAAKRRPSRVGKTGELRELGGLGTLGRTASVRVGWPACVMQTRGWQ